MVKKKLKSKIVKKEIVSKDNSLVNNKVSEHILKEIEKEISKKQVKVEEKKVVKEDLEEIVKLVKNVKPVSSHGYLSKFVSEDSGFYGILSQDKPLDYKYLFSYLNTKSSVSSFESYNESSNVSSLVDFGDKELLDHKEVMDYAVKQATNFLLGTSMNEISFDEKEKFNAFMTNPSNKIIFLINYSMLGMNYTMPTPSTNISDSEIKEKSLKNDTAISLRFDTKSSYAKEDSK